MTESAAGEIGPEEVVGTAEAGLHAAAAVANAAAGNWDGAADGALSMSESALGVATFGASTALEEGWDTVAKDTGLPSAHEGLAAITHAGGDLLGGGVESLVGDEQAHQSAVAFDDGDILGGLGHMAEGAAETVGNAVGQGLSEAGGALGGLMDDPALATPMPEEGGS
ncbi:MAG TPA: hypothetical protein VMI33_08080 [Streptosporangiaceae bacterium]|nr:hypothetical protein [Streptosporangiaceae bacterium]